MGISIFGGPSPLLSDATPVDVVSTAAAVGASNQAARGDHTHKLIDSGWLTPTLLNGWVQYPGFAAIGYRKIGTIVYLRGLIRNGTASLMFTLPVGYRPGGLMLLGAEAGGGHGRVDIDPNGNVTSGSNNAYIQLDFSFVADG